MMKALLRGLLALPLIGFALSPANATYVGVATGTMWIPGNAVTEDFNSFANGYYLHLDTAVGDMYNVKLSDADVTGVHVLGATRITSYNVCYTKLLRVAGALAQGRNRDRDLVEAEVEVLAEGAVLHHLREILVGRGEHPHVDRDRLASADPLDHAVLQKVV